MDFKTIFNFLSEIKENNNREWMDANKKVYLEAKGAFVSITESLINGVAGFDESLIGLEPKQSIFRINRDIRFSKDKSPYKTNFGAYMVPGGKKSGNAGYYLHLQPGDESFIAGGVYMPQAENLTKIRQEIDYNVSELKTITEAPKFMEFFGAIEGEKLKKAPKGYPIDHPNLELLKLKSFLVIHKVKDSQVLKTGFIDYVLTVFKAMEPFNSYLNVAMS